MKVLMVEPGYAPYETELNGLREMQAAVGGTLKVNPKRKTARKPPEPPQR